MLHAVSLGQARLKARALSRRQWLFGGAAIGVALAAGPRAFAAQGASNSPAKKPNVLLILSDDQGYGDLACHGNPDIQTPHLDRLAAQSTEFTRFYVSPVCAPTRASVLTGRYNVRTGVHGVTAGKETMPIDETTIAESFRAEGYRTALIGKWHLGEAYPNVPHGQGFETFIGMRNGHWNDYFDAAIEKNGEPYLAKGYIADALTNEAIAYMGAHREEPFFLYLAYNTPHTPFQVEDRYWKKFADRGMPIELAAIYGMVENLDENIGRLLAALAELDLAEETIVIFFTDNGPNGDRYNAGLRGRKGAVYEGGVRVPFFLRWPGKAAAGRKVDRIASAVDIFPTLTSLCAVPPPQALPLDGMDLSPLLRSAKAAAASAQWPDRALFTHREREGDEASLYPGAIRTQRYNLVNGTELYDMLRDPGERVNLAPAHPELVRELRGRYEDWFHTALAARGFERFPIPVGYPEENPVTLPATQAYFTGGIRFYGRNGYSHDWLTEWSNAADTIHWDVDLVQAGRYRATLLYLAPEDAIGTVIEIRCGDEAKQAKLSAATSMKPLPDRNLVLVPHYQSMDWGRLEIGEIALPQRRAKLEIRCAAEKGARVMDVKALELRRL
ncbi:MAG: arylsulfatase [Bryobacterales bacterium]|nr:arylsulfatase [Bryobacterales bacterium]